MAFIYFSSLITVAKTSNIVFNTSCESGHPCFFKILAKRFLSFDHWVIDWLLVCHKYYLWCWDILTLVPLVVKNLPASARDIRDLCLIPGLGRSPGDGNGNPLQYSYMENLRNRGGWQATVHGVTKSQIRLSDWACKLLLLQSMGSRRMGFSSRGS